MADNLFWSALVGAVAWMVTKHWEITERKRARYIEIVSRVPSLLLEGTTEGRQELLREVCKLWIDGSPRVIKAVEKAMSAIEQSTGTAEDDWRDLIIEMRRDAAPFWRLSNISPDQIKFRSAR